ncbi:MAG TPA: glycosyltransferase [Thermoanaerobaculia bacterium]|nr:glycosyltransferase [Thermoanaerobaculia bacterium]
MSSDLPRICYLVTGLGFGGAERELVQLASGLARCGWPVEVVSLLPAGGLAGELEAAGVPVTSLGMARGKPSVRALLRLAAHLREHPPALLHSFMVHANLMARLVRLLAPVPALISTAQNTREGGRLRSWSIRLTDPLCDLTTQVSRAGFERYRNQGLARPENLLLVPNSVDLDRLRALPGTREQVRAELGAGARFVWLAVGRLEVQKDYPTLIQAVARLVEEGRDVVVWVAGQGPEAASLRAQAEVAGLGERLLWLGLRPDVPRLLAAADGFVMSSAWEGTPLALLEALAAGLPAVATAVGGCPEVLEMGELVPAGDPAALAAAMATLMALPAAARRDRGEAGRASVAARYGLAATLGRWEGIYRRLLSERR